MAEKENKKSTPAEIRKIAESGKLILGTAKTVKELKLGNIKKVFVTSNCPDSVKEDIGKYASLSNAEVEEIEIPNDEMGVICKKPFSISIAGIMKD